MPSPETRPDIVSRLMSETKEHGFEPFHVRKTSTGYIYNRYASPSFAELPDRRLIKSGYGLRSNAKL